MATAAQLEEERGLSVKSDPTFNSTLQSIRDTINKCKQRKPNQDAAISYQSQIFNSRITPPSAG